jgi:tetratricopeptide (TPR) repeat protein
MFSFLNAEIGQSKNLQNELDSIKLEIEKLKIIHEQSTVYKIIELENSIKELESKIVEDKIDTKGFEKEFEKYDEIINRQDEKIGSNFTILEIVVAFFGVLVTVIVIIFSFRNSAIARAEANKELQNWIKENQEKILTPIQNEADKLSSEIQEQIDEFFKDAKERLSEHNIKEELNNRDKELLTKITNSLKNKHEENYTYNDWYSLYLEEYYKKERVHKLKALEYIDKAINSTKEPYEELKARFEKAVLLGKINKIQKELNEYEYILKNYDYKEEKFQRLIAFSYYNKGVRLGEFNKSEEAIEVYNKVIERFEKSTNEDILKSVASALVNKGVALGTLGKNKEAIEVYDEAIERFEKSINEDILDSVAIVLVNKIELAIFEGLDIEEDIKLCKEKFPKDNKMLAVIEMMGIINNAKTKAQDNEIKIWLEKYEDMKFADWNFDELKSWSKTIKDCEAKERIEKYIAIFEKKLQNDSQIV